MNETTENKFIQVLNESYSWPSDYSFKFIVKKESLDQLKDVLPEGEISLRESGGKKYSALTLKREVSSGEEVLEIYNKAEKVEGIITL